MFFEVSYVFGPRGEKPRVPANLMPNEKLPPRTRMARRVL